MEPLVEEKRIGGQNMEINEQAFDWTIEEKFAPLVKALEAQNVEEPEKVLENYMWMQADVNGENYYKHVWTREYAVILPTGYVRRGILDLSEYGIVHIEVKDNENTPMTREVSVKELGAVLVAKFADWVGTPSEELLEDGGHVIDHLTDDGRQDREVLEALPQVRWAMAWDYFDRVTGRGQK